MDSRLRTAGMTNKNSHLRMSSLGLTRSATRRGIHCVFNLNTKDANNMKNKGTCQSKPYTEKLLLLCLLFGYSFLNIFEDIGDIIVINIIETDYLLP